MSSNVLIIEDVKEMSDLVAMYLVKEGFSVTQSETAENALDLLKTYTPDLVVLDLNLPGMDGFEFLEVFRKSSSIPVIIVSARDADEDIITGLGYGSDEFVTKPFSPRVLIARVKALIRRSSNIPEKEDANELIKFGPYILDCTSYTLRKKIDKDENQCERIMLSGKEFSVLEYLARNPGKALSPEVIYKEVWGNSFGDLSAVAVYMQRLRKKLEEDSSNPVYIETVFGLGYKFNLEKK